MSLRRIPKQARGERRIEAILAAAAQLFDELGYDAVTTILIAQRAKTTVGSLYDFFSNKEAIAQALIEGFSQDVTTLLDALVTESLINMPVEHALDLMVNPLVAFINTRPGFRALYLKAPHIGQLSAAQAQLEQVFSQRIAMLLRLRYASLPTEDAERIGRVGIVTTKALTSLAVERGDIDQQIIVDLKIMLLAYINHFTQPIAGL